MGHPVNVMTSLVTEIAEVWFVVVSKLNLMNLSMHTLYRIATQCSDL